MRRKQMWCGVAASAVLAAAAWAQTAQFSEDFESRNVGQDVVSQDKSYTSVSGAEPGFVAQNSGDAVNATKVLQHKGDKGTFITRLVDGTVAKLTGEVIGVCDVQPVEGDHLIVWWQDLTHYANMAAMVTFNNNDGSQAVLAQGDTGRLIGKFENGKWYRVTITMHVDATDGTKTNYDATVAELEAGGKVGKTIGSVTAINSHATPTYVTGGQVQSIKPKTGGVEGRFDNWSLKAKE